MKGVAWCVWTFNYHETIGKAALIAVIARVYKYVKPSDAAKVRYLDDRGNTSAGKGQ